MNNMKPIEIIQTALESYIQDCPSEAKSIDKAWSKIKFAALPTSQMKRKKKVKFICSHCKSNNIWFDACVKWDEVKQAYDVEQFGQAYCQECEGETREEEVVL